jgi:hypothetical protein
MLWEQVRLTPMSDPATNAQLQAYEDRLRALEDDHILRRNAAVDDGFDGVREFSRAWKENRSTAYLYRKSWADPVSRTFALGVLAVIAAVWTFILFF